MTLTKHIQRQKLIDLFINKMRHNIKEVDSQHKKKVNDHQYGINRSRHLYKSTVQERNRKHQSTRKYLLPFSEMNFLLISLIFFFNFFSSLPMIFSEGSPKQNENHIQQQNFAIGKSIPRKP